MIYQATSKALLNPECVCISLEKEVYIDFSPLHGYNHASKRRPASFATHIKMKLGEMNLLPLVCISHNFKKHVVDIHKCRKVSQMTFKLFLGVLDS